MRKIKLYIAVTLDGKIAAPDGNLDWLNEFNSPEEDYGYGDFMNSVDTILMGNNTYQQVLNFDSGFPYKNKQNFVFTRNSGLAKDENVTFIASEHLNFVRILKNEQGKNIWLVGGGEINSFFLANDLIDELRIFVIPVVLGEGIPLFAKSLVRKNFILLSSRVYANGVFELIYRI